MSQYVIQGTQGSYSYETIQNPAFNWKTFAIQFYNFQQDPIQSQPFIGGTTVITFSVPFQVAPAITANTTGLVPVVTQNSITVPSPPYNVVPIDPSINGVIVLEGF